jgi:hypothetical protein
VSQSELLLESSFVRAWSLSSIDMAFCEVVALPLASLDVLLSSASCASDDMSRRSAASATSSRTCHVCQLHFSC